MLILGILVSFVSLQLGTSSLRVSRRLRSPNILLILADDLRPDLVGAYQNEFFAWNSVTPNLDKVASEGVRFDHAFTVSPLCAPARFSLNTGHYNSRRSQVTRKRKVPELLGSVLPTDDQLYYVTNNGMLTDSEVEFYKNRTMGSLLRKLGYNSAGIGKWHMGLGMHEEAFNYSYLMATNSQDHAGWNVSDGAPGHNPEELTREAVHWLEQQRDATDPWFLYLSYTLPHSPYDVRQLLAEDPFTGQEPFLGPWQRDHRGLRQLKVTEVTREHVIAERMMLWESLEKRGLLDPPDERSKFEAALGAVLWLDYQIGRVLSKLNVLAMAEQTLVIFTADHGIVHPLGVGKGSLNNEGIRIPMLMRWPSRIPASTVSNDAVSLLDLLPTVLEVAGGQSREDTTTESLLLQGSSLVPLVTNAWPHEDLIGRPIFLEVGIARGVLKDGWKFIFVGPPAATSDGDVCAEAYGDYMSERKTGRLEKSFFCHRQVCAAEQLYRYSQGCEQESIALNEASLVRDLRRRVEEHIQANEGFLPMSEKVLFQRRRRDLQIEGALAARGQEGQQLFASRIRFEEQSGRTGCNDEWLTTVSIAKGQPWTMLEKGGTASCDYRWHTYFMNAGFMADAFLVYTNGSRVPTTSGWSSMPEFSATAAPADAGAWTASKDARADVVTSPLDPVRSTDPPGSMWTATIQHVQESANEFPKLVSRPRHIQVLGQAAKSFGWRHGDIEAPRSKLEEDLQSFFGGPAEFPFR